MNIVPHSAAQSPQAWANFLQTQACSFHLGNRPRQQQFPVTIEPLVAFDDRRQNIAFSPPLQHPIRHAADRGYFG
jgi:hypothetical protein